MFFGENFVVTFQERAGDPFNPVRKRIEAGAQPLAGTQAPTISPMR